MTNRYVPDPFGWFCVGYPRFPGGPPRPLLLGDTWSAGVTRPARSTQDAFCPTSHLGHGGTVEGCEIRCPFHGWQFDADGNNTLIPYSERLNRKATLRTYPTVERNGLVFAWYHPHAEEPRWEVPVVAELDDPDWTAVGRTEYTIDACWQEMAENAVDAAHFRYVHNTATVPELEEYTTGFPEAVMRSSQKFPTPRGVVEGRIDSHAWGPGISVVNFSGIVDTINLAVTTPVEADRCVVRFNFNVWTMGDDDTTRRVGEAFAAEVDSRCARTCPSGSTRPTWCVIWRHRRPVHESSASGRRSSTPSLSPDERPSSRRRSGPTGSTTPGKATAAACWTGEERHRG